MRTALNVEANFLQVRAQSFSNGTKIEYSYRFILVLGARLMAGSYSTSLLNNFQGQCRASSYLSHFNGGTQRNASLNVTDHVARSVDGGRWLKSKLVTYTFTITELDADRQQQDEVARNADWPTPTGGFSWNTNAKYSKQASCTMEASKQHAKSC